MQISLTTTKRLFDLSIAATGLLLLAPVFLIVAFLVKITSSGPIIFCQTRTGQFGKSFRLFKFRSMVQSSETLGSSVVTDRDLRITRVGKILRKTKLDELPQLWNVLIGELSVVGPRPDVPEITNTYSPEMLRILEIKPGLTSVASLLLRDEQSLLSLADNPELVYRRIFVPMKIELNMEHIRKNSFWFDLSIFLRTIYNVVFKAFTPTVNPTVKHVQKKISEINKESMRGYVTGDINS